MSTSNNGIFFAASKTRKDALRDKHLFSNEEYRGNYGFGHVGYASYQDYQDAYTTLGDRIKKVKYFRSDYTQTELLNGKYHQNIPEPRESVRKLVNENTDIRASCFSGDSELKQDFFRRRPEYKALDGVLPTLKKLLASDTPPTKIFVMGLPSILSDNYQGVAARQHAYAKNLTISIRAMFRLVADAQTQDAYCPQIFVDSTHFTNDESELIISLYNPYDITLGPLGQLMDARQISNNFFIMFRPENPVRQFLADRLEGDAMPAALICAPSLVDNQISSNCMESRNLYSGDRNSDLVAQWLSNYECMDKLTSAFQLAEDSESVYGDTHLHVRKDVFEKAKKIDVDSARTPLPLSPLGPTILPEFIKQG